MLIDTRHSWVQHAFQYLLIENKYELFSRVPTIAASAVGVIFCKFFQVLISDNKNNALSECYNFIIYLNEEMFRDKNKHQNFFVF